MFGLKKTKRMNATCVMPLTEGNLKLLKMMQMNHPIPEEAKYIAFLEDGDACFLEGLESDRPFGLPPFPTFGTYTYYTDIPIEYED